MQAIAERYLLRELQELFRADGLTEPALDVLIVAGSVAYPEYLQIGGYVCTVERRFRKVDYLAFYADGEIKPQIPRIRHRRDHVPMNLDHVAKLRKDDQQWDGEIADLSTRCDRQVALVGTELRKNHVFVSTDPNDPDLLELPAPVKNDSTDRNGRPCPFTYGQPRYTRAVTLRARPATTSEMVKLDQRTPGST